jgi:hypothetical protein
LRPGGPSERRFFADAQNGGDLGELESVVESHGDDLAMLGLEVLHGFAHLSMFRVWKPQESLKKQCDVPDRAKRFMGRG